jgi:3-oxoacyl-[acyl-carrier protein] reductase
MLPDLKGKVAIVTGGGRGLGKAMTLALAEAGVDVVVAGHIPHDIDPIRLAVTELGRGRCHAMLADVRKPDDCERIVQAALDRFGGLHILVNNAGLGMTLVSPTFTSSRPKFWTCTPDVWRAIMDTNANGPFNMARAAAPHMVARKWGRIVNVTTGIDTMQRGGYSPYGPSKAALEAASCAWAEDLKDSGVTVNVLMPGGPTDTDILPGRKGDPNRDGTGRTLLSPDVMRAPILWLASNESDGVTARRFTGRLWDPAIEPAAAAEAAGAKAGFTDRV